MPEQEVGGPATLCCTGHPTVAPLVATSAEQGGCLSGVAHACPAAERVGRSDPSGVDVHGSGAVLRDVVDHRSGEGLAREHDRLPRWLQRRAPALPVVGLSHPLLCHHLRHVLRLREALAVEPHQAVADLPPGVLDGDHEPMVGARASKRQQVSARLGDSQDSGPELDTGNSVVPTLPHEGQPVGRIGHYGIEVVVLDLGEHCSAVAGLDP